MTVIATKATLDDLYRVEGKAELIDGRIVEIMASGDIPGSVALEITVRLREYSRSSGIGRAYADGVGFALLVPLDNGRESFCPDAAFVLATNQPRSMRFLEGSPDFAVEVRSENDYGPAAEQEMADKRQDYFQAGTRVVWDVDPISESITRYTANDPTASGVMFRRGDSANAEPVLPGWTVDVNRLTAMRRRDRCPGQDGPTKTAAPLVGGTARTGLTIFATDPVTSQSLWVGVPPLGGIRPKTA
jgi:Uma2 family endonuclease